MKKTNFTIHSLARVANWCLPLILLVLSFSAKAQIPCNLVCNDHVNASMPATPGCTRIFEADDFLENPDPQCAYTVDLVHPFGTTQSGNTVDRSHIGYTFVYRILDPQGNSCWGTVTIEDKAPPQPACKSRNISCFQLSQLTLLTNTVVDNCAQEGRSKIERLRVIPLGNGCDSVAGIARVIRDIRSWDTWGNTGVCTDTLTITRDSLQDIKCAELVEFNCRATFKLDSDPTNTKKQIKITFSKDKTSPDYPSPDLLLKLRNDYTCSSPQWYVADTLPATNPESYRVVPQIADSVTFVDNTVSPAVCIIRDSCVDMWPLIGGVCKTTVGWSDEILEICPGGSGFKIRRQWRIANWCTNTDTVCIQYIKVEDKEKPKLTWDKKDPKLKSFNYSASAHDCYANVTLPALTVDDCGPTDQNYTISYADAGHPGKTIVLAGTLPASIKLPSPAFGDCHQVDIRVVDKCFNDSVTYYQVCVQDNTPPTPVCDEFTQTTVDPATCWARVYAHDLDNGSRDNCCNVLHFAVAHMDSITTYTNTWVNYWNANCKADYWANKSSYDNFLNTWINCFIFKDYIDLTECGTNQVVLRVYEACGVPRYDAHVFPCSEHDWFTYNTYRLCRAWHNFQFFNDDYGTKSCTARFGPVCKPEGWRPKDKDKNDIAFVYESQYYGAVADLSILCDDFATTGVGEGPTAVNGSNGVAPGNRCPGRLYNDCMVNILVDDKTPPRADDIPTTFWYCDDVASTENNRFEYAVDACEDDNYEDSYFDWLTKYPNGKLDAYKDNIRDFTCRDIDGAPYGQIECFIENGDTTDVRDSTGKYFGWYGCNTYGAAHAANDHTPAAACASEEATYQNNATWAPVYCHTWLCLDRKDRAGKVDPKSAFKKPKLSSVGPPSSLASNEFGMWDNCWIDAASLTSTDQSFIDKCGTGWISRTWTVKDKCGHSVSATHKIITKHRSDFEVTFPQDTTVSCANDGAFGTDITGRPMIMDDECELVGVNYEDVRYDVVVDACYKIVRTWKLIDWCKYDPNAHHRDPEVIVDDRLVAGADRYCVYRNLKDDGDGYITYTQIIKVVDNTPPSVTCANDTLCITTGYGGFGAEPDPMCTVPTYSSKDFAGTDDCTPANQISFRWELDVNNDGSVNTKSAPNQKRFTSSTLIVGTHKLIVIAEDNCGNEDTTSCLITVLDCKKPTPYCYNGIATVVMPSTGNVVVWATDLNAGSYDNCTKKADLKFSFDKEGKLASDTFTCADIPNGVSATVEVDIYVWDQTGNSDFCRTYLLIQDGNGNKCEDKAGVAASIAGKIATESTEPVESVILEVKGSSAIPAYKTASNGNYAFNNLVMKGDYSVAPKRDDDPTNGVSTVDLVLIQKHILGVQSLNSAYKVIAADVDRSNDVSAVDLVELRKLILTVYDKLPSNTSWRFVPKSYNFSNVSNPWGFPEKLDITGLSKDELGRDFVGVKVGDVNGTVVPHSLLGAEARELGAALKFRTSDRTLAAGEEAVVEFTADNFNGIEGYQFSMAVKGLEIKSIQSGVLKVSDANFGMTKLGNGYVTTSWNESKGISAGSNDVLFSVKVKATKALTLSESLVINSKYTRAEAYNGANSLAVALEVGKKSTAGYALHQNTPNPFKSTTVVSYELAKSDKVTLKITDVTGKVVRVYTENGNKGLNQFKLNRNDISGAGVLYYSIETKDFSATKKMIIVE